MRHRSLAIAARLPLLALGFFWFGALRGQVGWIQEIPSYSGFEVALPLCASSTFNYAVHPGSAAHCLFYQVDVLTTGNVIVSTNASNAAWVPASQTGSFTCQSFAQPVNINGQVAIGSYYIVVQWDPTVPTTVQITLGGGITCPGDCSDCLPSMELEANAWYMVSAWVRQENAPLSAVNFTAPGITVTLGGGGTYAFAPDLAHPVTEGWQLVEGRFQTPNNAAAAVSIELTCSSGTCLFDDLRLFPADGSMKCYVYDPVNLRFTAELDERHYATFYEYDNEGKLIRVKKETERGIMTIQESRQNAAHIP